MTSSRLPGKVLMQAEGKPMLELMIERLRYVPELDDLVVATTSNGTDDPIEGLARKLGVNVWRGSEANVLNRVLEAAQEYRADVIVELTGDCPLIDPHIVSKVIGRYRTAGVDYVSNVLTRSYPDGMDTQVFATAVLADVASRTMDSEDLEHVSRFIYHHPEIYSLANVLASPAETRPSLRLTLDTARDYEVICAVFAELRPSRSDFSLRDILSFLGQKPAVAMINGSTGT